MLQLNNIVKTYVTGDLKQNALKGVSLNFRDNEFVSILGHSGSGKTTMLNIIGGLDRYTSGDLIINGVSTKKYKDADWDIYRNNKIGFVFQSYNLIPHQTVLSNVEMALTLSGVGKKERRARAEAVLKKVGLGDHIHKKPNQMSGGQMQRVAIARALVNNPDILLADEPTGALDSDTSIQIMELLKEIAKDKLVIMVTHNPDLAEQYSNRIVRLKDGEIISDTNPYTECDAPAEPKTTKKISMSFFTALSLSFNNLKTKKGRTILTSFAGSIGIIGIALILALSTGMNAYISNIQKDTMSSYPITINSQNINLSSLMGPNGTPSSSVSEGNRTGIYADYNKLQTSQAVSSAIQKNNLTAFKKYLDDPNSEIHQYLGENGIIYGYDVAFNVYCYDASGNLINTDSDPTDSGSSLYPAAGGSSGTSGMLSAMTSESKIAGNFSEIMAGTNGSLISQVVTDSYELLHGAWPTQNNEIILVLDNNNSIAADTMYQLGLISGEKYREIADTIKNGGEAEEISFDYADVCNRTFYLVPACDYYTQNSDGTFSYVEDLTFYKDTLIDGAIELKVAGIVRPTEDTSNANISTVVAYTSALTDRVIAHTAESPIVTAQMRTPETNVLNGMSFNVASDSEKVSVITAYISSMSVSEKASFYKMLVSSGMTPGAGGGGSVQPDDATIATMLDGWLASNPDTKTMLALYNQIIGNTSYEDNIAAFGNVNYDTPSSISIYADNFEDKEAIAQCINNYNATVDKNSQITYTDIVAIMTSSLTTIINLISYVLIAFVAVSLFVSCIMIGIITHISVMERTKEIGILRALGASKSNISQVFNAETFIIGCCSGLVGIGISLLSLIPINLIISSLSGIADLSAQLPLASALILIVISIIITMLGGLLPAMSAAKKDPVIALRSE